MKDTLRTMALLAIIAGPLPFILAYDVVFNDHNSTYVDPCAGSGSDTAYQECRWLEDEAREAAWDAAFDRGMH